MTIRWMTGGLGLKTLSMRIYYGILQDDILGRSAQLSYYFLLALVPLLIFLTSVFGLVIDQNLDLRDQLFLYLADVMPQSAFELIKQSVLQVSASSTGGKLSLGLLVSFWAASAGMGAVTASLNAAYGVAETRPWWWQRLLALGLTLILALLIFFALLVVFYGGKLTDLIAGAHGYGATFRWTWKILQWPIAIVFLLLNFESIYFCLPNLKHPKFHWITPGSVFATSSWILLSVGFRTYLDYFNSYDKTYGSLGAVIILMLWLYLTGAAMLVGGKVNSEISRARGKSAIGIALPVRKGPADV